MTGLSKSWYEFALAFNTQAAKVHQWAMQKGFWDEEEVREPNKAGGVVRKMESLTVPAKIALIHSELSEAMEAHREGNRFDDKLPERSGIEVELADAVIRIMDLAGALGLDVGGAIGDKMKYNESRPYKHGKDY